MTNLMFCDLLNVPLTFALLPFSGPHPIFFHDQTSAAVVNLSVRPLHSQPVTLEGCSLICRCFLDVSWGYGMCKYYSIQG